MYQYSNQLVITGILVLNICYRAEDIIKYQDYSFILEYIILTDKTIACLKNKVAWSKIVLFFIGHAGQSLIFKASAY